ncbi:hypothetical protein E1B28_006881 [Marasmius oreades]|uniref:HECT-type E3 ubiquitin transferase n=1 Tax=Marasmius oreades TaxID=181124 RepID=A0A9P7S0P6_9AGAR|nr:uncharacterized protein E1B28_006881 [Marasmius oreades]KAG7093192.1 hypothetical protein E1B28_006881 [Marasmius oreades]
MLPLFNGADSSRRRQINLGGTSTTNTAQSTLESAKARRHERIEHRRRVDAAVRVQGWWRGELERRRIRERIFREIDERLSADLLEVGIVRRVCFVGRQNVDEKHRAVLGKWSRGIVGRYLERLSTVPSLNLKIIATILLSLVSKDVLSPFTPYHISFLTALTSISKLPPSPDFYSLLSDSLREITKSSPALPNLITLLFSPPTSDENIRLLLIHILTIPLLPNRLPLQTLTTFSASLPLTQLSPRIVKTIVSSLKLDDRVHLLSNLLVFTPPRYTKLPKQALAGYLKLVADILDGLPINIFDPEAAKTPESEGEDMTMNGIRVTVVDSFDSPPSIPPPVDGKTLKRVQTLVSSTHISSLLTSTSTSNTTSPVRYQMLRVLSAILRIWPGKRDSLVSLIWNNTGTGGGGQVGGIVKELWRGWVRSSGLGREMMSSSSESLHGGLVPLAQPRSRLLGESEEDQVQDPWPALLLLSEIYTQALGTMGDDEFFGSGGAGGSGRGSTSYAKASASSVAAGMKNQNPLTLDDLTLLSRMVLNVVWVLYAYPTPSTPPPSYSSSSSSSWNSIRMTLTRMLRAIHARDARRSFVTPSHWIKLGGGEDGWNGFVEAALAEEERLRLAEEDSESYSMDVDGSAPPSTTYGSRRKATTARMRQNRRHEHLAKHQRILEDIPFAVPFELRVRVFRAYVALDGVVRRDTAGGVGVSRVAGSASMVQAINDFNRSGRYRSRRRNRVEIRRTHLSQDGFDKLGADTLDLKDPVEVVFRDQWGEEEAGIDGGGLFKEFFTSLSKEVFDLSRGLWSVNKEGELYPRAGGWSEQAHSLAWYRFIGRILGKALYDGILVDVVFAQFFLAKWLHIQSPTFFDDLRSLDEELWNGLVFLKRLETEGEIEQLGLRFCVDVEEFGQAITNDLIPNGSQVAVTKDNRLQYIYLLAHFKLSKQIRKQSEAFFEGVGEVIEERWIRMFTPNELSHLLGGSSQPVDLEDLRQHTNYGGLYDERDPIIKTFWEVVNAFTEDQRRSLLRFVTSCSRPPLLGFKELYPQFAIRDAGEDQNRLPTASTCVNLLKLPRYSSPSVLRAKLLQAINSGAGFDLS